MNLRGNGNKHSVHNIIRYFMSYFTEKIDIIIKELPQTLTRSTNLLEYIPKYSSSSTHCKNDLTTCLAMVRLGLEHFLQEVG